MNKKVHIAILVLIGLLTMMLFSGCKQVEEPGVEVEEPEVEVEEPSVAFIPEQWYLSDEAPYPEYGNNGYWGLIEIRMRWIMILFRYGMVMSLLS